ncbi:MAG: NRDE family protein [Chitinophagaceae bacterium]
MCTVTFVPSEKGIILTSSRDERPTRSSALMPLTYTKGNKKILYPRDQHAGGSWIAVKNNGDAAVLLNGAFKRHVPKPPYRKSRGLIFLEIIEAKKPVTHFNQMGLADIEPFTIILYSNRQLHECRWDGDTKHHIICSIITPHIWSSATLYDETIADQRYQWFTQWHTSASAINQDQVLKFHQSAGNGDSCNDILMNRPGIMSTVSITSLHLEEGSSRVIYYDLKNNEQSISVLKADMRSDKKEPAGKAFRQRLNRFIIRASHWEYWPFIVVYMPALIYWFWLCIRARSFFFFNTSNPSISNGGLLMESKKEIYDLIPKEYYPRTILFKKTETENLIGLIKENQLGFPLIAKPDIGMKGLAVKKINTATELTAYAASSKVNFIVQEFIPYENEVGIFYYRVPGEAKGHISGIVGKEFLSVTGNGFSTIRELLHEDKRFILQLPVLSKTYPEELDIILAEGEKKLLVPYGNHARGAKFIDISHLADQELTESIDAVCKQVKDFYFGRLDIKYNTWEELKQGKNFSIIELNGAGSEPTHIYDPAHSIFFAWKEIIRHWNILFHISRINHRRLRKPYLNTREGLQLLRDNKDYVKLISGDML